MQKIIKDNIQESIDMKMRLKTQAPVIEQIVNCIVDAYKNENKVIIFGNGGSAADAQHIAGEFVGRFFKERKALPCLALHANTSIITAIGNDYGFDYIFKRQVEANLKPGDVVIGISTSGNSQNVIEAINYANDNGGVTIALVGEKPCKLDEIASIVLKIPSSSTPRIQEGHITAGHIICYLVEQELFGE
ncbi:MAG TPA: D-sedoheptulose 7-phosphate isomerase [Candidatus Lokiarchaeia archaeon]|nr:D-sedoheptulose 7-phosphate isomerase [Candidatus Lokiarchaeia archaeon]